MLQALRFQLTLPHMKYATISPYKRGESVEIPKEVVEDVDLPVINQQLKRLARRLAYQIELDCVTVIAAAVPVLTVLHAQAKPSRLQAQNLLRQALQAWKISTPPKH